MQHVLWQGWILLFFVQVRNISIYFHLSEKRSLYIFPFLKPWSETGIARACFWLHLAQNIQNLSVALIALM